MSNVSKGHDRERKLVAWYRARGWFAMRAPGSLGIDVIALKHDVLPEFVEVKTTVRPFHNFSPDDRHKLADEAAKAGAIPLLCHWPPRQREPTFIDPTGWP